MKKSLILFAIVCYSTVFSQIQTTVTFKPNAAIGQDADIFTSIPRNCILSGNNQPVADINYGTVAGFSAVSWTWSSQGCSGGTLRALLKFEELSTIPVNAVILNAELKLYGLPSNTGGLIVNTSYPGAPSSFYSNSSLIQRVTSDWDEQTVTWNTQPTTTTANQITIPQSTTQWNWNFTDASTNLVTMIQDMVNNPSTNFGFMMKLNTESPYRALLFASSDHSDSTLWPELTVTYEYPCDVNFSYMVNTSNPNTYYFTALDSVWGQQWVVDGHYASSARVFNYTFSAGNHQVCYYNPMYNITRIPLCEKCITICVEEQTDLNILESNDLYKEKKSEVKTITNVVQGEIPSGDAVFEDAISDKVKVYPNPTANDWTIKVIAEKEETIKIQLSDGNGKIVYSDSKILTVGDNSFIINASNLMPGVYNLYIIGNTIEFSHILLKE